MRQFRGSKGDDEGESGSFAPCKSLIAWSAAVPAALPSSLGRMRFRAGSPAAGTAALQATPVDVIRCPLSPNPRRCALTRSEGGSSISANREVPVCSHARGDGVIEPRSRRPDPDLPPDLLLWRRVSGFVPWWTWLVAVAVVMAAVLPFWLHTSPAPYHHYHGDVYRGWPEVYGLDQGDVGGDEWGPFVTYLDPRQLAWDTFLGVMCGLPPAVAVVWGVRRLRRHPDDRGESDTAHKPDP
jgi:hypothetical protein